MESFLESYHDFSDGVFTSRLKLSLLFGSKCRFNFRFFCYFGLKLMTGVEYLLRFELVGTRIVAKSCFNGIFTLFQVMDSDFVLIFSGSVII